MSNNIPINRVNKFFTKDDFDLNIKLAEEYLYNDINIKLILYRVDVLKTSTDSVYAEVGKDIVNNSAPNNPYQAWVDTYSGEEFHTAVNNVIQTIDRVAARCDADTLEKMHQAYTKAAELEWLFWDSAYHQRQWLGLDQV